MVDVVGKVVFPGHALNLDTMPNRPERIVIGNGLIQNQDQVFVTKAGVLRHAPPARFWVENNQRRYVPVLDDMVIGVVCDRHAEEYKLELGGPHPATLSAIAFEGATKRNRPNLQVGDLVYCRIAVADKDMEPEVTCLCPTNKHGWMTGQATYGELKDGHMFTCDSELVSILMGAKCEILDVIGGRFPFEITVGMNGRVWVRAASPKTTIVAARAMQACRGKSREELSSLVSQLLDHTQGGEESESDSPDAEMAEDGPGVPGA